MVVGEDRQANHHKGQRHNKPGGRGWSVALKLMEEDPATRDGEYDDE